MCVAGRGPFDDAVAAMLVQVLAQRGVTVDRVPHNAVSRDAIAELDVANVAVFVVSYLELAGTPTRLRSLVKRLRAHAPAARIVVGLWPEGDATLGDVNVRGARRRCLRRFAAGGRRRHAGGGAARGLI